MQNLKCVICEDGLNLAVYTHRHTQRDTHTDTHTQTHTQRHAHRHTHTQRRRDTRTQRHTHTETHAHRDTQTHTQRHTRTETHAQTHTQTHTHRHTHTHSEPFERHAHSTSCRVSLTQSLIARLTHQSPTTFPHTHLIHINVTQFSKRTLREPLRSNIETLKAAKKLHTCGVTRAFFKTWYLIFAPIYATKFYLSISCSLFLSIYTIYTCGTFIAAWRQIPIEENISNPKSTSLPVWNGESLCTSSCIASQASTGKTPEMTLTPENNLEKAFFFFFLNSRPIRIIQ